MLLSQVAKPGLLREPVRVADRHLRPAEGATCDGGADRHGLVTGSLDEGGQRLRTKPQEIGETRSGWEVGKEEEEEECAKAWTLARGFHACTIRVLHKDKSIFKYLLALFFWLI